MSFCWYNNPSQQQFEGTDFPKVRVFSGIMFCIASIIGQFFFPLSFPFRVTLLLIFEDKRTWDPKWGIGLGSDLKRDYLYHV